MHRNTSTGWLDSTDEGFTMVELVVVLLILAILLTIAIPTFLGTANVANNRSAQANLNTGLTTVKAAISRGNQTYTGVFSNLSTSEPSIKWVSATAVTTQGLVSVFVPKSGNGIIMAAYSKNSTTCWYTVDNLLVIPAADTGVGTPYGASSVAAGDVTHVPTNPGTYFSSGTGPCDPTATPTAAQVASGGGWATSFSGVT